MVEFLKVSQFWFEALVRLGVYAVMLGAFWVPVAAYGCAKDYSAISAGESPSNEYESQYSNQLEIVKARIQEQFPDVTDVKLKENGAQPFYDYEFVLQLTERNRVKTLSDTSVKYNAKNGEFTDASIDVRPALRELGISRLFLLEILRQQPQTTKLPVGLSEMNESNFVVSTALEVDGNTLKSLAYKRVSSTQYRETVDELFRDEIAALKPGKNVKGYRERVLKAIQTTPAWKIRDSVGFSKVKKVSISVTGKDELDIGFDIEKGSALAADEIEVVIFDSVGDKVRSRELLPTGRIQESFLLSSKRPSGRHNQAPLGVDSQE